MPGGQKIHGGGGSTSDLGWTQEPEEGFIAQLPPSSISPSPQLTASLNPSQSFNYSQANPLLPVNMEDEMTFELQQSASQQSKLNTQKNVLRRSNWETGEATPPMPHKRKKDKKEKKKKDKKAKKEMKISAPLNVRHFGMPESLHNVSNKGPLVLQQQAKFPVEHLATMPVEGQLQSLSPYDSYRRVQSLIQSGATWTKEVVLVVTATSLMIKHGETRTFIQEIPLLSIVRCEYLPGPSNHSNVLMVATDNQLWAFEQKVHFFQCSRTPAEMICNEIKMAREKIQNRPPPSSQKSISTNQSSENIRQNWILQSKPHSFPPSPPSQSPPPPPPPSQPPPPPSPPSSPPMPFTGGNQLADPQTSNSPAPSSRAPPPSVSQAMPTFPPGSRDEATDFEATGTPSNQRRMGEAVRSASTKYVSNVHSRSGGGGADVEIKRTMKASRIQRDVDILNHVFHDLDGFMGLLTSKAAAWVELEKKKKKSKRKKHDAALEALRQKAEPPSEKEFLEAYQKCKYALNIIAKLGHHLSAPSASELQRGIFEFIIKLVSINKGPQLASTVTSPLLTQQAVFLLERKLPAMETELWKRLGANWFLTSDQWPRGVPLPPDYLVVFSDGCIPPNLHDSSDCPANFPTLATLPRERRNPEYSEAYDGTSQPETESSLMINPAVMAAVASKAASVTSSIIPDVVQRKGLMKTTSQHSLTSQGSGGEPGTRNARALFDYNATTLEELNIRKGERVEILDDSRNWWLVKNYLGGTGYLPSNLLELIPQRKKSVDGGDTIDLHGKRVPAPPKLAPPPVPSPSASNRRPSITGAKNPPQHTHITRKLSHSSQLTTVPELSESRGSTLSRPAYPLLASPPTFSPTPPPQTSSFEPAPPPLPPTLAAPGGPGGPPLPPPPPPVQAPKTPITFSEMISQHKSKSKQEGKSRKTSVLQQQSIDIAAALKTRKPLRKTSTSTNLEGVGSLGGGNRGLEGELMSKLKGRKLSVAQEETDSAYKILPWKAKKLEIKLWLIDQGYGDCTEKLTESIKEGRQLYALRREDMKELFGAGDGVRLFCQLQKDRPQAEKEGGVAKESAFQQLMRQRKNMADHTGGGETTVLKFRRPPPPTEERETILDERSSQNWRSKYPPRGRGQTDPETYRRNQHYRDDAVTPRGRQQLDNYDSRSLRRGRRILDDFYDEKSSERARREGRDEGRRSRRVSRYSEVYSDDEDFMRGRRRGGREEGRGGRKEKEERRGRREEVGVKSQRSSRYSEAYSDDEWTRRERTGGRRRRESRNSFDYESSLKRRGKKKGPTNIDDFEDWSDSGTESDSESYTSSSESSDSSWSNSDSERERKSRLRSSASASELTNAAWTLGEGSGNDLEARIKAQEKEIKNLLTSLGDLQKALGVKNLPAEKRSTLQNDLKKIEKLQQTRKEKRGDTGVLMQMIGLQMLLSEHLKEAIETVKTKELPQSPSSRNLHLQLLQQPASSSAPLSPQQQHQLLLEQRRRASEMEQAQQNAAILAAAEQQRQQLQLAQLVAQQQQQQQQQQMQQQQMQLQQYQLGVGLGVGGAGMLYATSPYGGVAYY